jgi:CheY-like chemotaxis protein
MNPLKILLVDDSKSARYALRLQLQQHNVMVETADAAESALERVRQSPPDAIFMDHTMPGMSGFEALDILKTSPATAHIPVVICISHQSPELITQAKKKGAFDILSKTTAPEALEKLLDRLQQIKATPMDIVAAVGETAQEAGDAQTREGLDERIRTLFESLMDERAERLTADLIAKVDQRIDTLARAPAKAVVDDLSERLAKDLMAKTEERLVSRLNMQAERLREQFFSAQTETSNTQIYLLSTGAALIGIVSAAVVFLLLS